MRSDPADFELYLPTNLEAAVALLADQPKTWLPIAGGTDIMVQYAAGTLGSRRLLSIWNLPELRRIDMLPHEWQIGAGSTYTDIRQLETIARELPLLTLAASWTGGIANQNRGTLGGNIVNASPAADSLPALLAYDAELILVSRRGERRMPYRDFHLGYKKMNRAEDELIRAVCLPRKFSAHISYARKVGARNAQAIAKVAIAALARVENDRIEDVRIALGSVAPTPIRLTRAEQTIVGKRLDRELVVLAQRAAVSEVRPISDIRSTLRYRAAVVSNLVGEFLERLGDSRHEGKHALARWNQISLEQAKEEILTCCGSQSWALAMAGRRPIESESALVELADEIWGNLSEADWMEAFKSHPRIGESRPEPSPSRQTLANQWSAQEQRGVGGASDIVKDKLEALNQEYEQRFGHIFIVCATNKSAQEILEILERRLHNDQRAELQEAAEQQRQITRLRLEKWLRQ
jgi:OHCU decarboxylase